MIDLHCHILPAIDDGPADELGSIELARAAVASGTRTVVATPHVSPGYPNRPREIAALVGRLRGELAREGIPLEVRTGGEVSARALRELSEEELSSLTLGGAGCVLLECPLSRDADGFDGAALELAARGYRVLLAHPERCPAFRADPPRLAALVAAGMLCSITAGSLSGDFGETVQDFTAALADEELIHNVVSDAHNTGRRPPGALAALAGSELEPLAPWLTEQVPAALLAGGPIPPRPGGA